MQLQVGRNLHSCICGARKGVVFNRSPQFPLGLLGLEPKSPGQSLVALERVLEYPGKGSKSLRYPVPSWCSGSGVMTQPKLLAPLIATFGLDPKHPGTSAQSL